jgi:polyisoprenoid-binding protein YceI
MMTTLRCLLAAAAVLVIAGCNRPQAPNAPAVALTAPAGTYKLDPNHASLVARVRHFGLADYHVRFTKFDVTLTLDPAKPGGSSLAMTLDPLSVRTDYTGDFRATHPDSPYGTFEERLARDPKFFNADQFPSIGFRSTRVEDLGKGRFRVTGDLSFLGQSRPVTLDAALTGSMEKHPFTGRGALGFTATGSFKRSEWGMTGTQQYLGDEVTLTFDGEFGQAAPQEPAPAPAT